MRRVITVNLGGNAFALDEDAYERLRAYVSITESRLGTNPDRAEILSDLERAVAEHIVAERGTTDAAVVSDAAMQSALGKVGTVEHADSADTVEAADARPAYAYSSASTSTLAESEYTRVVVLLLCLFVGWLGVHRFFVGKIGTGVLQLCTLGGLGIWAFIDLILIICGEFKDKSGRKILRWA